MSTVRGSDYSGGNENTVGKANTDRSDSHVICTPSLMILLSLKPPGLLHVAFAVIITHLLTVTDTLALLSLPHVCFHH